MSVWGSRGGGGLLPAPSSVICEARAGRSAESTWPPQSQHPSMSPGCHRDARFSWAVSTFPNTASGVLCPKVRVSLAQIRLCTNPTHGNKAMPRIPQPQGHGWSVVEICHPFTGLYQPEAAYEASWDPLGWSVRGHRKPPLSRGPASSLLIL